MTHLIRRAYRVAGRRVSYEQKQSVIALARRVTPSRFKPRLRRFAQTLRAADPGGTGRDKHERQLERHVRTTSRALWMGFTEDAVADLERVRRAGDTPRGAVTRAAETLARWYAIENKSELALDRLIQVRILSGRHHSVRLLILEHHLLTRLGHFDEAERLFREHGAVSPDLHLLSANTQLGRAEAGVLARREADAERLGLIDQVFRWRGLTPISELVDSSDPLRFTSLRSTPAHDTQVSTQPLVSVVVPAYGAESTLAVSVNSLRAQTVGDLEILIVDDASTDETEAVAKSLAAADPRVRVIRHDQNRGAYGARNTGLREATGTYVTVHDSDDWSHPQLLEYQLNTLREKNAVASFSRLARVTPEFEFMLRPYRPMLEPIHWNYTSLLARTTTLRDFGGWDTVRAHADSELIERLRDHFGRHALVETEAEVPLSFFLVTGANLTERKDTGMRSVDFGTRREYTEQARFWRRQTFAEGELPSYRRHERADGRSPFYVARSLAPDRDGRTRAYDLVLGSDLALTGGTRRCNLAYIDCARSLGLRIGIFNAPRYRMRNSGGIDDGYRERFQLDGIDLLTPEDDVSANALIMHHPPVLRHAFDGYPRVRAAGHYLLVNQLPWQMKDYSSSEYDATMVHERFAHAFGAEPTWISISPLVRRYLEPQVPEGHLLDEDWYPIVGWPEYASPGHPARSVRQGSLPVLGRHSRDHATKWPEHRETLEKAYMAGTDHEVRLLGGAASAETVLGYRPKNWVVYPFDTLSARDFVQNIDIFLHFHHSLYIEEFGRNIAEAMAMGVPCVLPTEYEETFGGAAVYAEPDHVADTIRTLWADQDRYGEYSRLGASFVSQHCSFDVGVQRIAALLR